MCIRRGDGNSECARCALARKLKQSLWLAALGIELGISAVGAFSVYSRSCGSFPRELQIKACKIRNVFETVKMRSLVLQL